MYVMVDNYDSFTAMLTSYFVELGAHVETFCNDALSLPTMKEVHQTGILEGIIVSPGPKNPHECGNCREIVLWAAAVGVPLFGVCLGHQILASVFGAQVLRGKQPMHGKVSMVHTNGSGVFKGLPREFPVTRYHSLIVEEKSLPSFLKVDARTEDGVIMALRHEKLPLFGVQFHPESVRTQYGHEIIANFMSTAASFAQTKWLPAT